MGFLMWAAYRQAANESVPAPVDKSTPDAPWWYDHVAAQAKRWAEMGITAVLLPPPHKTNAGSFIGADGYGTFDDYDIGSKNQFYSVATQFGTREQLQRCIAICRANGLDVYVDIVPHQRMGGRNGVYHYLGADGVTENGRFPKRPSYFRGDPKDGRVPEDPVPVPADDFSFGDELCPINAQPKGAVMTGLLDAGDWLFRSLGIQGCRLDDTKGMAVEFVTAWANHGAMAGKLVIGEYADGNGQNLNGWVWGGTQGRCCAFDFGTHYPVESMCNNDSAWNMEQLGGGSLADLSADHAVTFVESPDTDTDGFATIVFNKAQAYHWIATRTGYPAIYYKDWSTDAGCYGAGGLQPHIQNSVWLQAKLAKGPMVQRWADYQVFAFERTGSPGLLCAINNDQWTVHTITVQTSFGAYVHLKDYTGHAPDIWTDPTGKATIALPRNVNGLGTVAYSTLGHEGPVATKSFRTQQSFFGASDLDLKPATNGATVALPAIWCAGGSELIATLKPDTTGWTEDSAIEVAVRDHAGIILGSSAWRGPNPTEQGLRISAKEGGNTFLITGSGLPGPTSYELGVDYQGSKVFQA